MFQEEVADLTADHLREHIRALLDEISAHYDDGVQLVTPKSIETDNLVGGVYSSKVGSMPAYAVDIINKTFAGESPEGLWIYAYDGHIAGIVSGSSEEVVNKSVKRHEAATELFVKRHEFMHALESPKGQDFRLRELGFTGAAFSGAEMVDEENNRQTWIAGFRIDLLWLVSEFGPTQHG
jgi:hypothetical protein